MAAKDKKDHDKTVVRLARMLTMLNAGDKLDPAQLAVEFGVTLRTVQRDLGDRFSYLPLEKSGRLYCLDPAFLGKFSSKDIARFAALAGVRGLFPGLSDEFLREIFDGHTRNALMVKGHEYEDLTGKTELFRKLKEAIVARQRISFAYERKGEVKDYTGVEPYKLLNHKGIWYLVAKDHEKPKTFMFTRLERVQWSSETFAPDPSVERTLSENDGIWFGEDDKEVVLKVHREVAGYFRRRKLIANQVIEKELDDGGLLISAKVGHHNQILPIVRYWIPFVHIIAPEGLQAEMDAELRAYVERSGSRASAS